MRKLIVYDNYSRMLLILEMLLQTHGSIDSARFAASLLRWAVRGFPEVGDDGGYGLGNFSCVFCII